MTEKVRSDWPGFASVSDLASERFQEVAEPDGFADDALHPAGMLEMARSMKDSVSLATVARYFDVPESELLKQIVQAEDRTAEPTALKDMASPRAVEPLEALQAVAPLSARELSEREPDSPNTPTQRPAPRRTAASSYSSSRAVGTSSRPSSPSPTTFRDLLQALRRRLLIVILALILGAAAGWFTAPGESRQATTFRATHTLLYSAQGQQSYNIEQVALLATAGDVPSRVAGRLNLDRAEVRAAVSAVADSEVATISITARGSQAERAVSLADVTAEELRAGIDGAAQATYQADVTRLTAEVAAARAQLNGGKNPNDQMAARNKVDAADQALQRYLSNGAPKPQFRTLEAASASAVNASGVQAANSKSVRMALLGGLGLFAGIAGAVALTRLDSRIRSKSAAEEAFAAPVVAEVPRISKASEGELLARTQPSSAFVEAYRGLRTYLALWAPEGAEDDGHRVIVVTSPSPGEGKTTTVAHLAAMLAEIGRSVLVVSADLRRPRLHQYFDLPASPGLVDALGAQPGPSFEGLDRATSIRGVRLVPSGAPMENPAPLFEHAGDLLRSIRHLADFVLVDAPPLLVANDAVEIARYADGVLLVARAGQTPVEAAQRSAELLERLEIPVVGTVLVASEEASSASRYYAARYYAEPERTGWRGRRPAGGNGDRSTGKAPQPPGPSATAEASPTDTDS